MTNNIIEHEPKIWRQHWITLVRPLALWVALAILTLTAWTWFGIISPVAFPALVILGLLALGSSIPILQWRNRTYSLVGEKLLCESGILFKSTHSINYLFTSWKSSQSLLGRLFNYGDVTIGGELLDNVAQFREFQALLKQGRPPSTPPPQQTVVVPVPFALVFQAATAHDRQSAAAPPYLNEGRVISFDGEYTYRGQPFARDVPSYPGFLAFTDEFVLRRQNWSPEYYTHRDASRKYYPNGLAYGVGLFYIEQLEATRIITWGKTGASGWISPRIHSIKDIKRRVPDLVPYAKAA